MSGSNVATPLQLPTSSVTPDQALAFFVRQRLLKIQTITLVQVQARHGGGLSSPPTVDVLPLVNQVDGAGNSIAHVTLYGRPCVRWQSGENAVILDPQVGDIGVMGFGSRDLSSVISSLQAGPPPSGRTFNYADGIYLGSVLGGTPQNYVQIQDDGTINIVSTQPINLQAPSVNITTTGNVNINGAVISSAGEVTDKLGKVLGTHEHSGVQSGGSNTGPPV